MTKWNQRKKLSRFAEFDMYRQRGSVRISYVFHCPREGYVSLWVSSVVVDHAGIPGRWHGGLAASCFEHTFFTLTSASHTHDIGNFTAVVYHTWIGKTTHVPPAEQQVRTTSVDGPTSDGTAGTAAQRLPSTFRERTMVSSTSYTSS